MLDPYRLMYNANHGVCPVPGWRFDRHYRMIPIESQVVPIQGGRIQGGMALKNVETEEIENELYEKYGVQTYDNFIDKVSKDNNLSTEQKINFLLKEYIDNKTFYLSGEYEDDEETKEDAEGNMEIIESKLGNLFSQDPSLKNEFINKIKLQDDDVLTEIEKNHMYEKLDESSGFDKFKRGDMTEDELEKNNMLLEFIDKDNTRIYNTKNIEGYTKEFQNTLAKIITGDENMKKKNLQDEDINNIENLILKFVPVDFVKGNTIWEIKSFDKNLYNKDSSQYMKSTKLKGYEGPFSRQLSEILTPSKNLNPDFEYIEGNLKYDFEYTKDKPKKLKNIYFSFTGNKKDVDDKIKKEYNFDKIPLLKNNPNNYNYYWGYNNDKSFGYVNPMKYYKDILINKKDFKDGTKYGIKNTKINKLPYTYTDIYKKGQPLTEDSYKRRVFKRTPKY